MFTSGGSRGEPPHPPTSLFWVKKEEMTEERKAGRASKTKPGPPLAQSLDPPLFATVTAFHSRRSSYCAVNYLST